MEQRRLRFINDIQRSSDITKKQKKIHDDSLIHIIVHLDSDDDREASDVTTVTSCNVSSHTKATSQLPHNLIDRYLKTNFSVFIVANRFCELIINTLLAKWEKLMF